MPPALTYPGVYVQELPSGVRTITGVSTANTAFVDYFARGPMNVATRVTSLTEFDRVFGGLDSLSEASYGVTQYFLNGGTVAWIIRVAGGRDDAPTDAGKPAAKATLTVKDASNRPSFVVAASSEGTWAEKAIEVAVVRSPAAPKGPFNLFVRQLAVDSTGAVVTDATGPKVLALEEYRALTLDRRSSNFVEKAVAGSELIGVTVAAGTPGEPASSVGTDAGEPGPDAWKPPRGGPLTGSRNGTVPTTADELLGPAASNLRALDRIAPEIFNMLCIPLAATLEAGAAKSVYDTAVAYCIEKRAFLLVDIPTTITTPAQMRQALSNFPSDNHAAVYFPRLLMPDPRDSGRSRNVGSSGTLAGIYARTDATRGVWKAPAGTEATVRGADLVRVMTDGDNGGLNPHGINALRNFPVFGSVVWGSRTLDGADAKASEWKYVPVRRTALFIEESLFQGLKWVVFEPNDEPLWAQIRLNVGAFMNDLFRQGAFQGASPRQAYLVKCDGETTTQNDVNRGVVNVVVGFAPLKPAEFVVLKIQQLAGQVQV